MINLMCKKYVKSLSVDKPQRDNFPIENLLNRSEDSKLSFFTNTQNTGFVVDTFIRPPVMLTINFTNPINLQSLVLNAKVNTQISNGFIVESSTNFGSNYRQICRHVNTAQKHCHLYKFIRKRIYQIEDNDSESFNVVFFSANNQNFLDRVTNVRISIICTLNSSQPCLRSIEVYGCELGVVCGEECEVIDLSVSEDKVVVNKILIPLEFVDDLTHELMRMPVRLPSGRTIDKTTLDRHSKELEQTKRADQDPFTCIPFTSTPNFDSELKSRIDKFLLDNQGKVLIHESKHLDVQIPPINPILKRSNTEHIANETIKRNKPVLRSDLEVRRCKCCLNPKSASKAMYEISTCRHSYCRECLAGIGKVCVVCGVRFENCQVVNTDRLNL